MDASPALPSHELILALRLRAAILDRIRSFFRERGSLEVETPALVPCPGVDAHLDAIEATLRPGGEQGPHHRLWLTTSPEYHMKRLLAAGSGPIFQLAKAWRDGEVGDLHEPEFTMLEWYVPGLDDRGLMDECEELVRVLANEFAEGCLRTGSYCARVGPDDQPFERISFRQAFERHSGLDPDCAEPAQLGRILRASGVKPPGQADRDTLLDLVLACVVQPELGRDRPVFVCDWPKARAALARLRPAAGGDGEATAARFELYACGVELCNGYHELADAVEQEARIRVENERRMATGRTPYPVDEDFLAALRSGLPDCAGNALGVDRLLVLLLGRQRLDEVRSFRVDLP